MRKTHKVSVNLTATLVISLLMGCAYEINDRVTNDRLANDKPGSVIVDSSGYNEKEAKILAEAQCSKSNRHAEQIIHAKQIFKHKVNTSKDYHFKCI
jgi:hypothetical protein